MLIGQRFSGRPAIDSLNDGTPPMVDLKNAAGTAAEIHFLEQVFEWENPDLRALSILLGRLPKVGRVGQHQEPWPVV
jgi:hypothetical protein